MATLNGLPVFKIKISEDLNSKEGIEFISLVDYPAIESNWIALAEKNPIKLQFNQDRKLLAGPFLIPDQPIYRYDKQNGEYYVVFTKDEIEKIVRKFQKQNKNLNLNYQHQPNSQIEAVVQEIWLTGKADKSQDYGMTLPEGSAFAVTYIESDKFWSEQVKSGNVRGYSIEGWLDMELNKQTKIKMENQKFVEAKTTGGVTLKTEAETLVVGVDVIAVSAEGVESPAEGDYTLDNGSVIKCTAGKVVEIVEEVMQEELTPEEVSAMESLFSKIIQPLKDKITALETKLSNIPGAASKTEKTDTKEVVAKESHQKTVMNKVNRIKELSKK